MSDSEKPKVWLIRKQSIKYKWQVPFVLLVEWPCEWISYWLGRWAFLDILGHIGRLTILIAVITYFMEADERRTQAENQQKTKQYQAWQVITLAQGKTGGGGRKNALEDLHKDKIALVGVDVSKAFLLDLNLENARLYKANFAEALIWQANLVGAKFDKANLAGVDITYTKLAEAKFINSNLTGAQIIFSDLTRIDLQGVNLAGATFKYVNLYQANLKDIKNWQKIKSLEYTNIYGVKNPPEGFLKWATEQGAISIENRNEWIKLFNEKLQEHKRNNDN
jgi:uncharacterized protein YjbI with pentapeptide repeats